MPSNQVNVGVQNLSDGAQGVIARAGRQGEQIVSELHGRHYEQTLRGAMFSNGHLALTPLSANTITLGATTTPILGLWNPPGSGVNAVIIQASLTAGINNTAATGPGAFVWATSTGNNAITTGSTPFARFLGSAVSKVKGMAFVPLTGLTNNLVVQEASDMISPTVITTTAVPTTVVTPMINNVQIFDGGLIIPPGGVLALLNTVSTTTISVYGRVKWEEVPV
jgi:hypothetical protein